MGSASSHPVPTQPLIDYRLFHELVTTKSSQPSPPKTAQYTFVSSSSEDTKPVYTAQLHPLTPQSGKPDITVTCEGFEQVIGNIRFFSGKKIELALGDEDEEGEDVVLSREDGEKKRVAFDFVFKGEKYVWTVTRLAPFGGKEVREAILRKGVQEGGDGNGTGQMEQDEGEILALWRKKGWFGRGGVGSLWDKSGYDVGKKGVWEGVVVLGFLGVVEGVGK